MPATSIPRQAGAMLAPVALFALACGVHVAAQRRRPVAAAPLPALPAPAPAPVVDRFEAISAGRSALLRVHAGDIEDHGSAVLVVDRGDEMDLIGALPSPMAGGALGFACDRTLLEGEAAYWLQIDGRSIALPAPTERLL